MARTKMTKTKGLTCTPQMAAAIWAAAQLLAKQVTSADIPEGKYPLKGLELIVRFDENGKITKFVGGWHINTPSIPWKDVLVLFAEKMGAVADANNSILIDCINEAMETNGDKRKIIQDKVKNLDAASQKVDFHLSEIPKTWRTGRTEADASPTIILRQAEAEEEIITPPPAAIKPKKKNKGK